MKKQSLKILITVLSISIFFNSACKKSNTSPPVIILNGSPTVNLTIGTAYIDAGATANDPTDGDISWKIVTTYSPASGVNYNLVGTYYIYYNVSDAAGNQAAQQVRIVYVQNSIQNYSGDYSESIQCPSFRNGVDSISASPTVNNQIIISNFAMNSSANIYSNVTNNSIIIPQQTIGDTVYWGSGIINNTSHITFVITYSDSSISSGVVTKNCISTYTK